MLGKDGLPDFIPENIFYRLAMKAKNETAERFQALVADEIIPSIRKHGAYLAPEAVERILQDPDTIIQLATTIKEERTQRLRLQAENDQMKPKAEYFDELVERGINTSFRVTAKELSVQERAFVAFLTKKRYIFKDNKGRIMPYAEHVTSGLFVVKECISDRSNWSGTQTLITPKGRATFRLLTKGMAS
jgi:phage antirepressor YoqD-like protein